MAVTPSAVSEFRQKYGIKIELEDKPIAGFVTSHFSKVRHSDIWGENGSWNKNSANPRFARSMHHNLTRKAV